MYCPEFGVSRLVAGWYRRGVVVDDTTSVLRSSGVSVCKLLRIRHAILLAPPYITARINPERPSFCRFLHAFPSQ